MTLTAQQIAVRRKHLGASEAPAIVGLDPFKSAYDVYLSKVTDLTADDGSEAMDSGNRLEAVILDWAGEFLGKPVIDRGTHVVDARSGVLACTLDGRIDANEIVQAKSTGFPDEWGDAGTDAVPERVIVQTHQEMYVTGALVAWVPVLIGRWGLKFRMYRVVRDQTLAELVAQQGLKFWREHVEPRVPPTGSVPSLEFVKRLNREPGTVCEIDADEVEGWREAKKDLATWQKIVEGHEARIRAAIGECEAGHSTAGTVIRQKINRKGYTVEAGSYEKLKFIERKEATNGK